MGVLDSIVQVSISLLTGGLTLPGFGTPMILSHNAAWATDRIRYYTDADGVVADFAVTTPEYLAAAAVFSQEPRPERIAIGKANLKPTQRWKITVSTVESSKTYKGKVANVEWSFTSDSTATNDEVTTGIAAAIGTVAGFTITTPGAAGSTIVQIVASTPGNWVSLENLMPSHLSIVQDHADPGVATDLAEIALVDSNWYGLVTLYNSEAYVTAAAGWVEANEKLYIPMIVDTIVETQVFSGATDIVKDLYTLGYARTAALFKRSAHYFADAAWFGRCLSLDPGSETWMFKTLSGIPFDIFTGTQKNNVEQKRGNIYLQYAGASITETGITSSGEFIDTIRFRDWLKQQIQADCFLALKNSNKVPYTDEGIAIIETALRAVLDRGVAAGGIVRGSYTVTAPKVSAAAPADKAARILRGMKFKATLAGAIHKIVVQGEIIL